MLMMVKIEGRRPAERHWESRIEVRNNVSLLFRRLSLPQTPIDITQDTETDEILATSASSFSLRYTHKPACLKNFKVPDGPEYYRNWLDYGF